MSKALKIIIPRLLPLLSLVILTSCNVVHPVYPTSGQSIRATLDESITRNRQKLKSHHPTRPYLVHSKIPEKVNASLLPPLSHYINPTQHVTPRFDVAANNVPAKEYFMGLVVGTPYNMIVHPNISGTVSMNLKNVTLQQALEATRDMYGYEYHRTSYGYEIKQPQIETRMFHINYLDVQRKGRSYMQLTTGQVSNKVGTVSSGAIGNNNIVPINNNDPSNESNVGQGTISSVETKSEINFWKDIEKTLSGMMSKEEGHNVSINAQTGDIIIKAFPNELHRIARYLASMQTNLNRQVILEAKILEVELNKSFEAGIDWGILRKSNPIDPVTGLPNTEGGLSQFSNRAFHGTELTEFGGIFTLRINGNFNVIINLLQNQGNVQVLSSPHLSTVNNQKAVLKVGSDEFFVTSISTSNTILGVGTSTVPQQDVSLTPFFSGITLDVTPEISGKDSVILHIHPSISKVRQQNKEIGLGSNPNGTPNTLNLPLAYSTIRESDNIVRAKNGQVVVIGGLMQNLMDETLASTPGAGNIPFLGTLFRRTQQRSIKSELVILLRPVIVNNKTMIKKLEQERDNMEILQRPYHQGGFPLVFGNEAERTCND